MNTYLVGGAVRDALLNQPVHDRDWVVVGATPQALVERGYRQVGKDFPVFLHPETGEEYALARTERKTSAGYHGFSVDAGQHVTLEEDLQRRDLTINAIAQDEQGLLIDPWGGQQDLKNKWLRHVSPAFAEDPVRILRTARFAARYAPRGFRIAPETNDLMRQMVELGEAGALVAERVWQELSRALLEPAPQAFFEALRDCGALAVILPEVDALWGVPQRAQFHPEIDCGAHLLLCLEQAAKARADGPTRYAVLCHDLGKATTPADILPRHHGHEERGAALAESLSERLRTPADWRTLAVYTAAYHTHCHRAAELRPATLVDMLMAADILRRPERLERFLVACECDARGRAGFEHLPYPQADRVRAAALALKSVDAGAIAQATSNKSTLPEIIRRARIEAVKKALPTRE
ncbi:MAG: multifunctional CCA addition/repair protein [Granulosicoccaceae bacterium]